MEKRKEEKIRKRSLAETKEKCANTEQTNLTTQHDLSFQN